MAVLRTAQRFGLGGRIERRDRAGAPAQLALGGFEERSLVGLRNRQQPAFAFDHHPPHLAERGADERDPRGRVVLGDLAHPFGAGAGLAVAAPGHDQPGVPA
jgi:hypothetical protein